MDELRESCLLFSLKQHDRAREDELTSRRRAEDEMAARIRAEHRARLEQQALMVAEEARLRAEAAARREEAARHEAVRVAALDRARVEAVQAAQIALLSQQQEHERRVAALVAEHHGRTLTRTLIGVAGLTVGIVGTLTAVYFAHLRPEAERARRQEAREAYVTELKADVVRANQRAADARRAVAQSQGTPVRGAPLVDPSTPPR